jgi:hypothetical protein
MVGQGIQYGGAGHMVGQGMAGRFEVAPRQNQGRVSECSTRHSQRLHAMTGVRMRTMLVTVVRNTHKNTHELETQEGGASHTCACIHAGQ